MEKLLDRLLTVVFIIALLAIIYFVVQYVGKQILGNQDNDIEIEFVDDDMVLESDDFEDDIDEYFDDKNFEENEFAEEYYDEMADQLLEDVNEEDEEGNDEKPENKPVAEKKNNLMVNTTSKSSSHEMWRYMLVAGSFTSEENANIQIDLLEKTDYNPEIVNFNSSKMFTVIAGRYPTKSQATKALEKLKNKKIECYIHTKRLK